MKPLVVSQQFNASAEELFEIVAHIEVVSKIIPKIKKVVFLSEQKRGVGTRFAETRQMGKRQATMEFEVTEYDAPRTVRFVCEDDMQTVWDSVYELEDCNGVTNLTLTMHCNPKTFGVNLIWPLMKFIVKKGVQADFRYIADHLAQTTNSHE